MEFMAVLTWQFPHRFALKIAGILVVVSVLAVPALCAQRDKTAFIELLLQHPLQFDRPANRCEAEICRSLIALLDGATQSIDFAIYGARH